MDFKRKLIVLRVTKKYRQRVVPYGEDLSEIIYRYCIGMGILNDSSAYLFPAGDKYSHVSANSVGNYYRIIRKKAGISNKNNVKNGRELVYIALGILLLLDHLIKMSAME